MTGVQTCALPICFPVTIKGVEVVRALTESAIKADVKYITLYAFSTENWSRPKSEVDFLMKLLEKYLDKETHFYAKHEAKFKTLGDISKFSPALIKRIESVKEATKKHKKLTQILAINYGSKEFHVLANSGEDTIVVCDSCDYGANIVTGKQIGRAHV